MLSWFVAEAAELDHPRDRRIVAWSGFAPDFDVLGYLLAIIYYGFDKDLAFQHFWQPYHHRFTHGISFVLLIGIVAYLLGKRGHGQPERALKVAMLSILVATIHLFGDLVAGGPTWPLYPIWPFSDAAWSLSWSWTLAEWPNTLILFGCLAGMLLYARWVGYSPLEVFSYRLDRGFVAIAQQQDSQHRNHSASALKMRIIIYGLLLLVMIALLAPLVLAQ
jgi:hypothetical protein